MAGQPTGGGVSNPGAAASGPRISAPGAAISPTTLAVDPWSAIATNPDPWGASGANTPGQRITRDTPANRGAEQGQMVTDFLKGFMSTYTRPHNYGTATDTGNTGGTGDTPGAGDTGGGSMTAGTQPLHPIITPVTPPTGGGTPPDGGAPGGGGPPGGTGRNPGMKVQKTDNQGVTIVPTQPGGGSAPPAGATRVPAPSGMPQDLWQLPDGSRVRFPGYTG